jgi:hypothetical protein
VKEEEEVERIRAKSLLKTLPQILGRVANGLCAMNFGFGGALEAYHDYRAQWHANAD